MGTYGFSRKFYFLKGTKKKYWRLVLKCTSSRSFSNKQAPSTNTNANIITLNNKYVSNGVQLAIAVQKNRKLSKNALKRITQLQTKLNLGQRNILWAL